MILSLKYLSASGKLATGSSHRIAAPLSPIQTPYALLTARPGREDLKWNRRHLTVLIKRPVRQQLRRPPLCKNTMCMTDLRHRNIDDTRRPARGNPIQTGFVPLRPLYPPLTVTHGVEFAVIIVTRSPRAAFSASHTSIPVVHVLNAVTFAMPISFALDITSLVAFLPTRYSSLPLPSKKAKSVVSAVIVILSTELCQARLWLTARIRGRPAEE
jgi:hypothetical protein